jgi:hypothetical protein
MKRIEVKESEFKTKLDELSNITYDEDNNEITHRPEINKMEVDSFVVNDDEKGKLKLIYWGKLIDFLKENKITYKVKDG